MEAFRTLAANPLLAVSELGLRITGTTPVAPCLAFSKHARGPPRHIRFILDDGVLMAANRISDDVELYVLDRLAENGWQALMA